MALTGAGGADKETSQNIFNNHADGGSNFIDTANRYTNGTSEEFLGEFMQGCRERFVLGTKYFLQQSKGYGGRNQEQYRCRRLDVVKGVGQLTEHSLAVANVVKTVAQELGATPSQVALRWRLNRPGVTAPIIGARKIDRLQDNLGCLSVELPAEHLQRLNTASQTKSIFPNNFGATEMFRSAVDGESQIEGGFVEIYRQF